MNASAVIITSPKPDAIFLSVGVAPTETNPFVNKNPLSLIERGLYLFFPDER